MFATPAPAVVQEPVPPAAEDLAPATSQPEVEPPKAGSSRPDVVASSAATADYNAKLAGLLSDFITEEGWYDPQPSSKIFDNFQAWMALKYGHGIESLSKNKVSKILTEQLGVTWHKTGRGRLYSLPGHLRPASRPAGEDFPMVPVGPAPTSGPAPANEGLTVSPAEDVVILRPEGGNVVVAPDGSVTQQHGAPEAWVDNSFAVGAESALLAARTAAAVPDNVRLLRLPADGSSAVVPADGVYRVMPPLVDLPEAGNGGPVRVTAEGAFDVATGERLPGDDELPDISHAAAAVKALLGGVQLPAPAGYGEGGVVVLEEPLRNVTVQPDGTVTAEGTLPPGVDAGSVQGLSVGPVSAREVADLLPPDQRARALQLLGDEPVPAAEAAEGWRALPEGEDLPPADETDEVFEVAAAIADEEAAWKVEQARLEAARPPLSAADVVAATAAAAGVSVPTAEEQMAQDQAAMAEMAEQERNRPDAPAPVVHELPADPALPEGARLCSVGLTEEQIGWPLRRIAAIFDAFVEKQGLVRLGALADIELRKIMSRRYATAMVCPASSAPAEPASLEVPAGPAAEAFQAAINDAIAAGAATEWGPVPMGPGHEMPAPAPAREVTLEGSFMVALSDEEAELPFGALEALWVSRLPGGTIPAGSPVELVKDPETHGPAVLGAVRAVSSPAAPALPPVENEVAPSAVVSGEELQGLVSGAAADALAAYRAAAAGLSVPDYVADEGDWG